jgi:hypothetical protein
VLFLRFTAVCVCDRLTSELIPTKLLVLFCLTLLLLPCIRVWKFDALFRGLISVISFWLPRSLLPPFPVT